MITSESFYFSLSESNNSSSDVEDNQESADGPEREEFEENSDNESSSIEYRPINDTSDIVPTDFSS